MSQLLSSTLCTFADNKKIHVGKMLVKKQYKFPDRTKKIFGYTVGQKKTNVESAVTLKSVWV